MKKFLNRILDDAGAYFLALITTIAFILLSVFHRDKDYNAGYKAGQYDAIQGMEEYVKAKQIHK